MENHANSKFRGFFLGLSVMMSALFLFSPPFEKNPQQCEMVQYIGKKNGVRPTKNMNPKVILQ